MRKGFTLVELLIVIIIIGILATMAVPQYNRMVGRARWTEAVMFVDQIKTAENLYYAEYGDWTAADKTIADLGAYIDSNTIVNNLNFSFSIKTKGSIYACPIGKQATDDFGTGSLTTTPHYAYDLDDNATSYGGGAPGSM